jgi:hypothetical protein
MGAAMPPRHRRTALRVREGRVAKKNLWRSDPRDYFALPQSEIRLERRSPAYGCRHLITIAQLRAFIEVLPDWDEVAIGLRAIVLDDSDESMGWYGEGVVAVCSWERDLWWELADEGWVKEHRAILERLEVDCRALSAEEALDRWWQGLPRPRRPKPLRGSFLELRWTESQARAFQLLHILPHELGHHHDRITSRRQRSLGRGEPYAERYANDVFDALWPTYTGVFAT